MVPNAALAPTKAKKEEETRIRLSLDVSPKLNDLLTETAHKLGGSKSDVLRKAIILMNIAVEAQEEGKVLGIAWVLLTMLISQSASKLWGYNSLHKTEAI